MSNKNQAWAYRLAKRFAPFIIFHTEDKYRPSAVDWLLDKCTLQKADGTEIRFKKKEDLVEHNDRGARLILDGVQYRTGDIVQSKIYVHLRNAPRNECKDSLLYDIQYWVFYPFNGNVLDGRIGEHEGDWEHVTVRLRDMLTEPKVVSVFYSAHGKGQWLSPNNSLHFPKEKEAFLENGERLYAFAAKHSHAFFESEGIFKRWVILGDLTDQGDKWDTKDHLEIISDSFTSQYLHFSKTNIVPDFTFKPRIKVSEKNLWWMCFKGLWGKHKNSPVGPLAKRVWARGLAKNKIMWVENKEVDQFEMV